MVLAEKSRVSCVNCSTTASALLPGGIAIASGIVTGMIMKLAEFDSPGDELFNDVTAFGVPGDGPKPSVAPLDAANLTDASRKKGFGVSWQSGLHYCPLRVAAPLVDSHRTATHTLPSSQPSQLSTAGWMSPKSRMNTQGQSFDPVKGTEMTPKVDGSNL